MIKDDRLPLKEKFLEYYKEVPKQKLAGAYIGRDEDTISRWKAEDTEFAERIEAARAEWARSEIRKVRDYRWKIEKMLQDDFTPTPSTVVNVYQNLTDDQLDELIESKRRKIGAASSASGEGATDSGESA